MPNTRRKIKYILQLYWRIIFGSKKKLLRSRLLNEILIFPRPWSNQKWRHNGNSERFRKDSERMHCWYHLQILCFFLKATPIPIWNLPYKGHRQRLIKKKMVATYQITLSQLLDLSTFSILLWRIIEKKSISFTSKLVDMRNYDVATHWQKNNKYFYFFKNPRCDSSIIQFRQFYFVLRFKNMVYTQSRN